MLIQPGHVLGFDNCDDVRAAKLATNAVVHVWRTIRPSLLTAACEKQESSDEDSDVHSCSSNPIAPMKKGGAPKRPAFLCPLGNSLKRPRLAPLRSARRPLPGRAAHSRGPRRSRCN